MCLFPKIIDNPKYKGSRKNNYRPPAVVPEFAKIAIPCGYCIECRKKRARDWIIRLKEEVRRDRKGYFVTLTYSDESLQKLITRVKTDEAKEVARISVRLFLERYRKKYKVSCKHWLITELGHEGTKRLHLHGFIWSSIPEEELKKLWGYGWIYCGKEINDKTINYCAKYVTKFDKERPTFTPKIFVSPGLGKGYINEKTKAIHKFNFDSTIDYYSEKGKKIALPKYYKDKLYTEEERLFFWKRVIDKGEKYVLGMKFDNSSLRQYYAAQREAQKYSRKLGYRPIQKWEKITYAAKI